MLKKFFVLALCAVFMLAMGCTNYSANSYSGDQVRAAQNVQHGTVTLVNPVDLEEKDGGGLGTVAGGVAGGVIGNLFGAGKGRTLATVAGAALGAGAGYLGGKAATKQKGLEIEVQLDSGKSISIVQAADVVFVPGDRVRVLTSTSDGSARVVKE